MADQDMKKQWAKIVAKSWADEDYKNRLLADPAAVLKAEGVELPAGMEVKCVEGTATRLWLVLPPRPDDLGGDVAQVEERLAAKWINWCSPSCH